MTEQRTNIDVDVDVEFEHYARECEFGFLTKKKTKLYHSRNLPESFYHERIILEYSIFVVLVQVGNTSFSVRVFTGSDLITGSGPKLAI